MISPGGACRPSSSTSSGAESGCDPAAVNTSSGALGLTQIMPFWLTDLCQAGIACSPDDLLRPDTNLDAAQFVFGLQGWAAWSPTR